MTGASNAVAALIGASSRRRPDHDGSSAVAIVMHRVASRLTENGRREPPHAAQGREDPTPAFDVGSGNYNHFAPTVLSE